MANPKPTYKVCLRISTFILTNSTVQATMISPVLLHLSHQRSSSSHSYCTAAIFSLQSNLVSFSTSTCDHVIPLPEGLQYFLSGVRMKFKIETWPTSPAQSDSHPFLQLHLARVPQAFCILLIWPSFSSSSVVCSPSLKNLQTCHSHPLEHYSSPSAFFVWLTPIYSDP